MLSRADSVTDPGAFDRRAGGVSRLGARGESAGKRRRSRLSGRRGALPPRRDCPRKPALGRRFGVGAWRLPPPQRFARRPRRGRGGVARRVPSHPAGRRSRARGPAAPRLAGALRPLDRTLAFVFSTPPPRSWGFRTTRPCKRRSTPPRLAPAAAGLRRSPRRRSSASRGAR